MMKITKRLFASIIAAATLLSVVPAFAEETAVEPVTLAETENAALMDKYAEEIALLSGLGILTDTNIQMTNSITRAEFLALVMKTIKMDDAVTDSKDVIFCDVLPTDDYYSSIMSAHKMGLVNGDDKGCFNPDSPIDTVAALKILVCALDYGFIADAKGGYPRGYTEAARDLGLSDGITTYGNVNWKTAILIIDNALHANITEIVYTHDGKVVVGAGSKTILEKYYNLVRYTGVVDGTNITLRMEGKEREDTVLVINGVEYTGFSISPGEGDKLLGKKVVFYYNKDTNVATCVAEDGNRNTSFIIDAEDIVSANGTDSVTYYDENDRTKTVKIPDNAKVFYNGKKCFDLTKDDLMPENGSIEFINNDGGEYDFIVIESYEIMVLSRTASEKFVSLYNDGKDEKPRELDLKTIDVLIYKDGYEITKYHTGEWDVLNIMMSKDGKVAIIEVSEGELVGKVDAIKSKGKKKYLQIDGSLVEMADLFIEAYTRGDFTATEPQKGIAYTFALDGSGKIVGIKASTSTKLEYGVLAKAVQGDGLDAGYKVKIFGMYGTWIKTELAENAKINGKRDVNLISKLNELGDRGGKGAVQLVQYRLNDANEIAELVIAENRMAQGYDHEVFSLDDANTPGTSWDYITAISKIWTATKTGNPDRKDHFVDQRVNAPMFYVPYDKNKDGDYIFQMAYGNFSRYGASKTDIEVYDTVRYSEEYDIDRIGALVVYGRDGSTSYNINSLGTGGLPGTYFIVEQVAESIDADGDVGIQIDTICVTDGGKYSYFFAEDVYNVDTTNSYGYGGLKPEELKCGDVIRLTYDSSYKEKPELKLFAVYGKVDDYIDSSKNFVRFYHASITDVSEYEASQNQWPNTAALVGDVVYVDSFGLILHSKDTAGKDVYCSVLNNGKTFEYSVSGEYFEASTPAVIGKGDRVLFIGNMNGYNAAVLIRVVD